MKNNTVQGVLNELSPSLFILVKKNTDPQRWEDYQYVPCYTVGMALCYLFKFEDTDEGKAFWNSVLVKTKKPL